MTKTKKLCFVEILSNKAILWLMFGLMIVLLGFYFFQVQALIKNNYLFNKYQQELSEVKSQSLTFSQQAVEIMSLNKVEQEALALNFIKTNEVKYIPLSNDYLVYEKNSR